MDPKVKTLLDAVKQMFENRELLYDGYGFVVSGWDMDKVKAAVKELEEE